ncbi:MAG: hypothetical protein U1F51_06760 [Burkholderiales bacterium]
MRTQALAVASVLVAGLTGLVSPGAWSANWAPYGPANGRFAALATAPRVDGFVVGSTHATIDGQPGLRVFVSGDGGFRWTSATSVGLSPAGNGHGSVLAGGSGPTLYLETEQKLLRSDDRGVTWVPARGGGGGPAPRLASVNPDDGLDVLMIVDGVLERSFDGGATGVPIGPAGVSLASVDWFSRMVYAVYGAEGVVRVIGLASGTIVSSAPIPATAIAAEGNVAFLARAGDLYRSLDGGKTWKYALSEFGQVDVAGVAIASNPSGSVVAWEKAGGGRRIWRSTDNGDSWTVTTAPCACDWTSVTVIPPGGSAIIAGTTSGAFGSSDGAASFYALLPGLGVPGAPSVAVLSDDGDGNRKWIGPGPETAAYFTDDDGVTWKALPKSPNDDPVSPRFVHPDLTSFVVGTGKPKTTGTPVWVSEDAGTNWRSGYAAGGTSGADLVGLFTGPGPDQLVVVVRVHGGLEPSTDIRSSGDLGHIWSPLPAPPLAARAAAATTGAWLVGGDAGEGQPTLFRSTNRSQSWSPVALPVGARVFSLAAAPSFPGRVYAGTDAGDSSSVLVSIDGGLSWTPAGRGLGTGPIVSIAVHATRPTEVVVGQRGDGVFRSVDGGQSWTALDGGIVGSLIEGVAYDRYRTDVLYAANEVGGWRADLATGAPVSYPRAYEFHHAAFDHYFVTAQPAEVDVLDRGVIPGWTRTGHYALVETPDGLQKMAVCRFFGTGFAPKSSHFYTPYVNECDLLKADPIWVYEGVAFAWRLPDANGRCDLGRRPLYRVYNNAAGGAPNHRYTTNLSIVDAMQASGWVYEGDGRTLVFACVPN